MNGIAGFHVSEKAIPFFLKKVLKYAKRKSVNLLLFQEVKKGLENAKIVRFLQLNTENSLTNRINEFINRHIDVEHLAKANGVHLRGSFHKSMTARSCEIIQGLL